MEVELSEKSLIQIIKNSDSSIDPHGPLASTLAHDECVPFSSLEHHLRRFVVQAYRVTFHAKLYQKLLIYQERLL